MKTMMISGVAAAVFLAAAPLQAAELTSTTSLIKTHDQSVTYFDTFMNPVTKANNGITITYKGGPEVIPNRKQGAALKRGVIDIMFGPSVYYAGLVPCARVIPLSNIGQANLRKNGGWKVLQDCWAKGLNGHLLAHGMEGATEFHHYIAGDIKKSEKTGLDLKGMTMRSTAGYHPLMKAMGARPVNISPGDVYTSLERGVVKGLAWPEGGVARYGWAKFIKYRVGPGWWRTSSTIVVNLDTFKKLPKAQRDALEAAAIQYEKDSIPHHRALVEKDNAKVMAAGVTHIDLKGKYGKAYLATTYGATWDAAKSKMSPELYAKLRKLMLK
jgi:TRAP-type C4-dicarboxylate transport system substrate-binding protein